jgi:single-stranded-DNA-specific exonuclease
MTVERRIHRLHAALPAALKNSELHPVLQRVLAHRGIQSPQQIEYALERLLPVDSLKGLDAAVTILQTALQQQQHILIVGDFDADGATSTALAMRALKMMGATRVSYLVPNRFDFGYGLTPELVQVARDMKPDVLITVDSGIACLKGVAAARAAGITVIVTDHHLPGAQLPDANAIVNPNQPGCEFKSKNLAGVGVIFYTMLGLRQALRRAGWFNTTRPEPNMARLLDLVALGTVADVVPLDDNNRILVDQGLKRIRAGQCCPGIIALLKIAGRDSTKVVASDMGFAVGPRLNAAGRLEDMSIGIECLITDNLSRAQSLAKQLDDFNKARRDIEQDMQQQALESLQTLMGELGHAQLPRGLCLYDADWHQGVIGIVAARIKEKYNRPVIAFARSDKQGEIKGSARSIRGLHIRDLLENIAAQHPGLIIKFGGHAAAAGLSLLEQHWEDFRRAFENECTRMLNEDDLTGVIDSDGELESDDFGLPLAENLRAAGPWGQHFPEPVFDGEFEVLDWKVVGEKHLKLQLQPAEAEEPVEAIAFNADMQKIEQADGYIRAAYRLDVNEFRNQRKLQLVIEYFEAL